MNCGEVIDNGMLDMWDLVPANAEDILTTFHVQRKDSSLNLERFLESLLLP